MVSEMYIQGYSLSEEAPIFRVPENFDKYRAGSGWQAYQGGNDWENGTTGVAVYINPEGYNKEMARIWFEIKFPENLQEYVRSTKAYNLPEVQEVRKWSKRAAVRWIRETENVRKSTRKFHGVHDGYARDWVERKPWKECFILALQSDRMKPFVKEYGVDHTKWVGMKRCELNENGIPSKFWWMDPDGELIPVPKFGHARVGTSILKKKFGIETEHVFTELQARGYIRVGFAGLWSQYFIEINHNRNKPPTATQWRALKDLAIELGADSIDDNSTGLKVRVDESRLIFENFHENKEWFVYEGTNTLTTVFEDNSRQTFKLHFHNKRLREDRDKVRKKAANTWKRLAKEVRDSAGLSRAGNPIVIPWQECFQRALKHPDMLEYIDDLRATPIFESYEIPTEENTLSEMTYDDLRNSMKNYRSRSDMNRGTTTGSDSRERGAKEVRAKSLRVISTVGRDGNGHETSLFSYKSHPSNRDPRAQAEHPRWQGFIRFIESKQDGKPIDSPVAPVKDKQDVEVNCNCFSGDAPVLMSDGTYKPISKIEPGDFVYTHKGRIRQVLGNASRVVGENENVYNMKITGFPTDIVVTGNHPFYILRGNTICRCGCGNRLDDQTFKSLNPKTLLSRRYIQNHHPNSEWTDNKIIEETISLKDSGMKVKDISKKLKISKSSILNIISGKRRPFCLQPDEYPFQWVKVDNFKEKEWGLSPWLDEGRGGELNSNLARFLGYYAAEGNITNRDDVSFCFNLTELETLGKDSINTAEILYNLGVHFRLPQKRNKIQGNIWKICKHDKPTNKRPQQCFSINFHIKEEFKSFIENNIGRGSHAKKLSPWFMSLNNNTLKQFIIGLFLGDGTVKTTGHFRWTSMSNVLVYNVSTILRRLKIDHSITNIGSNMAIDVCHANSARQIFDWLRPYLRPSVITRRSKYPDHEEYHREEGCLKVFRNVKKIDYKKEVWDLCVEEDHSFIVAGIAVANCPDYKYVWAKANSDHDAGVTGADTPFKAQGGFKGGGNTNNNTMGKRIRNPNNTPGLCKHLIAVAEYIEGKVSQVAPVEPGKEEPDQVSPKPSKLKKRGKPINIFEQIRNFASSNPSFIVEYLD